MSSFTRFSGPLDTRKLEGNNYLLLQAFHYHVGSLESEEIITVPKGFISDGATIPRFLWPVIGHPMDHYAQAAFLHDYICRELRDRYNRKEGEVIMLEAMKVLGIPFWKRRIMYRGLRMFGWFLYNRKRKKEKSDA